MNRDEKKQLLDDLHELFNKSEILVVSHYKGLTVTEVSELRNAIRKAGAGFRVTKNRITKLALKDTKFESLADLFKGPTAVAFANDPVSACKACVEFAKNNEKLIIVGAPKLLGCCRLLLLSWHELPKHTAKKKLHRFLSNLFEFNFNLFGEKTWQI